MISPEIVFSEIFTTQKLKYTAIGGRDYIIWKQKILFIFANKGIDHVLHRTQPTDKTPTKEWRRDDAIGKNLIRQAVENNAVLPHHKLDTSKSMMDYLESIFNSNPPSIQRKINVFRRYRDCRMDENTNISKHVLEMQALVLELEMAGVKLPDDSQVTVLMNSLPESWSDLTDMLILQLKENELGFDNFSQRLRAAAEIVPRSGGYRGYCCLCRQLGHNLTNCSEDQKTRENCNSDNSLFAEDTLNMFEVHYQRIKTSKKLNYTGTNFSIWKFRLSLVLGGSELEYVINQPKPPEPTDSTPEQDVIKYKKWLSDDFTCRHIILGAMEDNLFLAFHNQSTAKALMEKLNDWFDFPSLHRKMALFRHYMEWQMSEKTDINDHIYHMTRMVGELKRAGIDVDDEMQAAVLINSLPTSWEDLRITITMRIDKETKKGEKMLDSTISSVRDAGDIRALTEKMKSNNDYPGKSKKKMGNQGRY